MRCFLSINTALTEHHDIDDDLQTSANKKLKRRVVVQEVKGFEGISEEPHHDHFPTKIK